jgi:hypothetical protein
MTTANDSTPMVPYHTYLVEGERYIEKRAYDDAMIQLEAWRALYFKTLSRAEQAEGKAESSLANARKSNGELIKAERDRDEWKAIADKASQTLVEYVEIGRAHV